MFLVLIISLCLVYIAPTVCQNYESHDYLRREHTLIKPYQGEYIEYDKFMTNIRNNIL